MLPYVSCQTGDKLPDNAVEGGYDDGPYYYAKGEVEGLTIPGKVGVKSDGNLDSACIPYGGKEHRIHSFEVLTVDDPSTLSYVSCQTGDSPPAKAVRGGYDEGPSYHARGKVQRKLIPGKVGVKGSPYVLKGACIPYGSREHRIHSFEVLVKVDMKVSE